MSSLCELYVTTGIVSAESQESLTDCDMEFDRIANVQNRKRTKTDILRKNASRVPIHFSFHLHQLLNLGWSVISCFNSCFTTEFNGLGLNSCLQWQIAPPLIERRVQNLLNQIPSLNSPSFFLTLEQKSLACCCLCLP